MKFPETKPRSPFYKMLSPLVEKAPMVPFISSFLRRRPGPRLFVQMGRREHSQGPERPARAGGSSGARWLLRRRSPAVGRARRCLGPSGKQD